MVRMIFGIIVLLIGVFDFVGILVRASVDKKNVDVELIQAFLVVSGILSTLGLALFLWGRQAWRKKRVFAGLMQGFKNSDKDFHGTAGTGEVIYAGIALVEGETLVATLIPNNIEKLYYQRGQVAAVTDRRLIVILPINALGARDLSKHYDLRSLAIEDVQSVEHKKAFALGGLFVGLILVGIATGYAVAGACGEIIGPGVVTVPVLTFPFGIALIFGVRRRVLTFTTGFGPIAWRSGPMQRSKHLVEQVRDFFHSRTIPLIGFMEKETGSEALRQRETRS